MEKFCKDCRHAVPPEGGSAHDYMRCSSPQNVKPAASPVTGEPIQITRWVYCVSARKFDDCCGPAAVWFEPLEARVAA